MIISADLMQTESWMGKIFKFSDTPSLTSELDYFNFEGRTFILLVGPMLLIFLA